MLGAEGLLRCRRGRTFGDWDEREREFRVEGDSLKKTSSGLVFEEVEFRGAGRDRSGKSWDAEEAALFLCLAVAAVGRAVPLALALLLC